MRRSENETDREENHKANSLEKLALLILFICIVILGFLIFLSYIAPPSILLWFCCAIPLSLLIFVIVIGLGINYLTKRKNR